MADLGNMNLTVGADISGLIKGMQVAEDGVMRFGKTIGQLETQLKSFQNGIKNSTNPESITRLNRAIDETKGRIDAINKSSSNAGKGLGNIKPGADQAGQSLVNLGRIAQDAPFGFIGIQNNINPLLESFQRLKLETGTTGGALKALAGSLTGAAGLGLAVSVVTGVLTVLAQSGFFSAGEKAKKAADDVNKFKDAIKGISEDAAKEQANVLILVKALESETVSRKEKLSAIKELQSINPIYFGDLKMEGELVKGLTTAYNRYKDSIIASVQNKIDTKRLETSLEKINTLEEKSAQNKSNLNLLEQRRADLQKAGADPSLVNNIDVSKENLNSNQALNREYKNRDEILQRIADRNFEGKTTIELEKTTKAAKDTSAAIKGIKDIADKDRIVFRGQIQVPTSGEILDRLQKAAEEANSKIGNDKRIKPLRLAVNLHPDFEAAEFQQRKEALFRKLPKAMQEQVITLAFKGDIKSADSFFKELISKNDAISQQINSTLNAALSSIGSSLAESITSGADLGKTIFGSLFKVIGAGLRQIGESMIALGTAKVALEKFSFAPGFSTIAAGLVTILAGSLLSNLPGFATGTQNFRGGLAMVGERGPELVSMPKGSNVTPNDKLGSISGGGTQVFIPSLRIQGRDLVVVFNKELKSMARTL